MQQKGPHQPLEELLKLTKENNKLLKKMHRNAIAGFIFKLIVWAVIIGLPLILYYYFLAPYIDQFFAIYSNIQGDINEIQEFREGLPKLSDIFDKFRGN